MVLNFSYSPFRNYVQINNLIHLEGSCFLTDSIAMTVIENLKRSTCNVFIKNIYRRFIIGHLVVHFGIQLAFLLGHHVNNIIAISIG